MLLRLLALVAGLTLLVGCPAPDGGSTGDDDTNQALDDDDVAPPDLSGTLPCSVIDGDSVTADVWELDAVGELHVTVDTFSQESRFDPAAYVTVDGAPDYPYGGAIGSGDDEIECTFHSDDLLDGLGRCPEFTSAPANGTLYLVIFGHDVGCNDTGQGIYLFTVDVDDIQIEANQVGDDVEVSLRI